MPLEKAIKISKEVVEPCVLANKIMSVTLLVSVIVNACLIIKFLF